MEINYPPNGESLIKTLECYESLRLAIKEAGGREFSIQELDKMSVMDLIFNIVGPNDIKFEYRPQGVLAWAELPVVDTNKQYPRYVF